MADSPAIGLYGGLTVAQLKAELASRGATLKGKKKDLIER